MKDEHLILARARRLRKGGDDHAGAISMALAERKYTYGHPADYLRTAFRLYDKLRAFEATPFVKAPPPPPDFRPVQVELPPPPPMLGRAAELEIRHRVYADRSVSAVMPAPKPRPEPKVIAVRVVSRDALRAVKRHLESQNPQ